MDLSQSIRRIRSDGWIPVLDDKNAPENGYGLYKKGPVQAHLVKMEIEGISRYVLQMQYDPDKRRYRIYKGRMEKYSSSEQIEVFD